MTFHELSELLSASLATEAFRLDLEAYAMRRPAERITASLPCPRVKVLRVVAQLLSAEPEITVDRVSVQARSGCADFVGRAAVIDRDGRQHDFDFEWNCEWKANELGYVDTFGLPDQIRAAQEFGWQCFAQWERASLDAPVSA